ncbi:MAG: short-chain dehydrogenase [Spirochaeta sp.]|nr:short-chain dehydrogenase [Spirochaeta sp.]RPG06336.1 MAG: SDR family oxidoreductase [Proteobacteria bacterium TMED72]
MHSKSMENRKSLVIGGGQGIGRAAALLLAQAGSDVAIVDTESDRLDSVAAEVRSLGVSSTSIVTDVTSDEGARRGVDQAWAELGGLDSVVNIVGSSSWGTLLELDEETWERDFSINLKHHWYVAKNAARRWIEAEQTGALCVVGSVSGLFSANNHGAYGAAKAGLLSLVRTAAEEWWPHDIRVNAVVPGTVLTPRIEAAWRDGSVRQPDADVLGRMALPEDIAQSIYFLVSDMSRRITGQSIVVDGGATTKFPFSLS